MTGPDDPVSADDITAIRELVELLRVQLDEVAAATDFQAEGLASLESNLTAIAVDMTEPAEIPTPPVAAPRSRPAGGDAGDEKDSVLSDVDNGAPRLDLLRPWVAANISSWCERKMSTTPSGGGMRWCARWYEHPEAITRLWALRAQQLIAADEGASALSAYLRDHFDHHIGVLTGQTGPFHACLPEKHEPASTTERRFLPTAHAPLHVVAG